MTDTEEPQTPSTEELEAFRAWQRDHAAPEAVTLAEAGAVPTQVDVAALLKRMEEMQARVDSLSALQGIPSDPVDAQVQALRAHVQAQANAHPTKDFSELIAELDGLPTSADITIDHTGLVKSVVEDHLTRFASIAHDLSYIWQLVGDLHRMILKAKVKVVAPGTTDGRNTKAVV